MVPFIVLFKKPDLDIKITCGSQCCRDPFNLLIPFLVFFLRKTGFEDRQRCTEPPGGNPHPVDIFWILPYRCFFCYLHQGLVGFPDSTKTIRTWCDSTI